jgi:hypothetical protein
VQGIFANAIREVKVTDKRDSGQGLINATIVGKHFGISANKINSILSELGWIKKSIKGWVVTELGKRVGGQQSEYKTGRLYAHWPKSILKNEIVVGMVHEAKGEVPTIIQDQAPITDKVEFREKFPGTHRANDGHWVRSISELMIDNWLYWAGVIHAYEKKLRIKEEVYPDFYLPTGNVYIEYWGYDNDPKYSSRKETKLEIYNRHELRLIQLTEKDIKNLDDILPKKLQDFGIYTE